VTQADIARALRAAQAAGLTVAEYFTTRDGVRVITTDGAARAGGRAPNPWDEVFDDGAAQ
jgi:hypothetical protein